MLVDLPSQLYNYFTQQQPQICKNKLDLPTSRYLSINLFICSETPPRGADRPADQDGGRGSAAGAGLQRARGARRAHRRLPERARPRQA